MLRISLASFVMIFFVLPLQSSAGDEKYSCETPGTLSSHPILEVSLAKPKDGNFDWDCQIRSETSGKKLLECNQHRIDTYKYHDRTVNPIRLVVDYGSDLQFKGQMGQEPDPRNGYIRPQGTYLKCVFSK